MENKKSNKLLFCLFNFEEALIVIMFPIMCILVLLATFTRYTGLFVTKFTWCEELARYLMIYIAYLGVGVGAKRGMHYNMTVVVGLLPYKAQKYAGLVASVITVIFLGVVSYLAFQFVARQYAVGQLSASLRLPVWIVYSAIFIGLTDMMVRTAIKAVKDFMRPGDSGVNVA